MCTNDELNDTIKEESLRFNRGFRALCGVYKALRDAVAMQSGEVQSLQASVNATGTMVAAHDKTLREVAELLPQIKAIVEPLYKARSFGMASRRFLFGLAKVLTALAVIANAVYWLMKVAEDIVV